MMKTQLVIGSLILMILAQFLSPTFIAAVSLPDMPGDPALTAVSAETSDQSTPANSVERRQAEARILNSTVRIYVETWVVKPDESGYEVNVAASHATLKDDRYLVTHNHFLVRPAGGDEMNHAMVTLADGDGQALFRGSASDFELVWEDAETLVITHRDEDLFEKLGFVSAEFIDWSSAPLEPGTEVAQVDWDGATTRVDWTRVKEIAVDDGVPRLVLTDGITLGASGGGIFWQGKHIANNWLLVQEVKASGELIGVSTKVALNSAPVADIPSQAVASK